MSDQPASQQPPAADKAADEAPEPEWQRRRRLDAIFGDSLPEQTTDDRSSGEAGREGKGDRWYREQVPPHHGG